MTFLQNFFNRPQPALTDPQAILNAAPPHIEKIVNPLHPYYPLGVGFPGYVVNAWSVPTLLAAFSGCIGTLSIVTYLAAKRMRPHVLTAELLTAFWFVFCGCLHLFFEGYYVYNFRDMGPRQDLFGQLWKEYSLGDSRYMTLNPFVITIESITVAIWGPLSLLTAYLILTTSPYRHPLQALVSLAHLYGCTLYYGTAMADEWLYGRQYSRPEAVYRWGYMVGGNAPWIVVPLVLSTDSVRKSARAFRVLERTTRVLDSTPVKKLQ